MVKVSPHALKGVGYVTSTISAISLAAVSWKSASQDTMLAVSLFGGTALSIVGMCCRSYAIESARKAFSTRWRGVAPNSSAAR